MRIIYTPGAWQQSYYPKLPPAPDLDDWALTAYKALHHRCILLNLMPDEWMSYKILREAYDEEKHHRYCIATRALARYGWKIKALIDDNVRPECHALVKASYTDSKQLETISNQLNATKHLSSGSLTPEYLIVGDIGANKDGMFRMPFNGTHHSSLFLTRLLRRADISEGQIHLVNATREDGVSLPIDTFIKILKPSKIILLSGPVIKKYHKKLDLITIPYPHPSWIKRFHYHKIDHWANRLIDAIDTEY